MLHSPRSMLATAAHELYQIPYLFYEVLLTIHGKYLSTLWRTEHETRFEARPSGALPPEGANLSSGDSSKTVEAVEKVVVGLVGSPKRAQTPPKQVRKNHKMGVSASKQGSDKDTKGFFNSLGRFWYYSCMFLYG